MLDQFGHLATITRQRGSHHYYIYINCANEDVPAARRTRTSSLCIYRRIRAFKMFFPFARRVESEERAPPQPVTLIALASERARELLVQDNFLRRHHTGAIFLTAFYRATI